MEVEASLGEPGSQTQKQAKETTISIVEITKIDRNGALLLHSLIGEGQQAVDIPSYCGSGEDKQITTITLVSTNRKFRTSGI